MPIRYCVTVDTEEEWDWASGYPTGPTSVRNIAELPLFQAICERTGAAVVYFTNHAVLANAESRAIIQNLSKKPKVEIGLHIHPWNTPPLAPVERVPARQSFLQNLPWDEQKAKLESTLAAFEESGLKPTSYRGGRYSTSPEIQQFLAERGLWVDCSVLPFTDLSGEDGPNYRDRDGTPVRHPGPQPMWELPLSLGFTRNNQRFWAKLLDSRPARTLRFGGIFQRLGIVSKAWLNFENPLGERMLQFLAFLRDTPVPFVSFTLHSSSLWPGGSPYSSPSGAVERIRERIASTLETVAGWPEFVPATMTEIATQLEGAATR